MVPPRQARPAVTFHTGGSSHHGFVNQDGCAGDERAYGACRRAESCPGYRIVSSACPKLCVWRRRNWGRPAWGQLTPHNHIARLICSIARSVAPARHIHTELRIYVNLALLGPCAPCRAGGSSLQFTAHPRPRTVSVQSIGGNPTYPRHSRCLALATFPHGLHSTQGTIPARKHAEMRP